MKIDTGGNPIIYYDMCAYCNLNTGGQHEPDCPLAIPLMIGVPFGERLPKAAQSITVKQPSEGWNGDNWGFLQNDKNSIVTMS